MLTFLEVDLTMVWAVELVQIGWESKVKTEKSESHLLRSVQVNQLASVKLP